MDKKDTAIIQRLQENSRASIRDIAKKTGIRPSTVHQRITRLKTSQLKNLKQRKSKLKKLLKVKPQMKKSNQQQLKSLKKKQKLKSYLKRPKKMKNQLRLRQHSSLIHLLIKHQKNKRQQPRRQKPHQRKTRRKIRTKMRHRKKWPKILQKLRKKKKKKRRSLLLQLPNLKKLLRSLSNWKMNLIKLKKKVFKMRN